MINLNYIAVAIVVAPLRHGDHAAICRIHRSAFAISNINTQVT